MWLVVGLGNPGRKYAGNRHNIGFRVVDELARRHGITGFRDKFGGEVGSGFIANEKVQLLKPMEYMNNSGFAVQRASQFFGVDAGSCVVVHDDIDLPMGRLRLKPGGGHGGHNGIRSIIDQVGDRDFLRVRVGVGRPDNSRGSTDSRVSKAVLSDFPADQASQVDELIDRAASSVEAILRGGIRDAMNEFNAKPEAAKSGESDESDESGKSSKAGEQKTSKGQTTKTETNQ